MASDEDTALAAQIHNELVDGPADDPDRFESVWNVWEKQHFPSCAIAAIAERVALVEG